MTILDIRNLKFAYKENLILNDINLELREGDFIAISGANGSGKSTLIKLILGELKKNAGEILINEIPIEDFTDFNKIGYVPQVNETSRISFPVTSKEYVMLNLYEHFNKFNRPTKKCQKIVENSFVSLNIENLMDRPVNQLSGGQAQRVMIARALVNAPDFLILDEPTVGIDQKNKEDFMDLLSHLNHDHGITILLVSHEIDVIENHVDSKVFLKEGRLSHV